MAGSRTRRAASPASGALTEAAVFGLPLPLGHGLRPDGSAYVTCGSPEVHGKSFSFPGTGPETLAFVQAMNGILTIRAALKAVRAECRDPDSDAFHSSAAGELVEDALRALGERL